MLNEYVVRFYDSKEHQEGFLEYICAVNIDQAKKIAQMICHELYQTNDSCGSDMKFQILA